jgi:hypothetical protein
MVLSTTKLNWILESLQEKGTTLSDVVISLLLSRQHHDHGAVKELAHDSLAILDCFHSHPRTQQQVLTMWSLNNSIKIYIDELSGLLMTEAGFHFSACIASDSQLAAFDIEHLGKRMGEMARSVWRIMEAMISADNDANMARDRAQHHHDQRKSVSHSKQRTIDCDGDITMEAPVNESGTDSEDEYWEQLGGFAELFEEGIDSNGQDNPATWRQQARL